MEDTFPEIVIAEAFDSEENDFDFENFPSKIGGEAVFLYPDDSLFKLLSCEACGAKLTFLLQVNNPIAVNDYLLRTLFVFYCEFCWTDTDSVTVIRQQLPQKNNFYSLEDKCIDPKLHSAFNSKVSAFYSKLSQTFTLFGKKASKKDRTLYREYSENFKEIAEGTFIPDSITESLSKSDKQQLAALLKKEGLKEEEVEDEDLEEDDLKRAENKMIDEFADKINPETDDVSRSFEIITKLHGNQIFRLARGALVPLWYKKKSVPSLEKRCSACNKASVFELQVMPYIFSCLTDILFMNIGTIALLTCSDSCGRQLTVLEHGLIQRTEEQILPKFLKKRSKLVKTQKVKEEDYDSEGFVDVKVKK